MTSLAQVGLKLNTSKTKILTTEAQPGRILRTSSGVTVEILDSRCAHKWLGCMLQANLVRNRDADLQHHLQAASRAFHANRSILTNHQVSVKDRLTFFHTVVTNKSWPQSMLHTATCSVRWLFRLLVWTGRVHGTKSCMIGTCELQLLWARPV